LLGCLYNTAFDIYVNANMPIRFISEDITCKTGCWIAKIKLWIAILRVTGTISLLFL
jgi:hypothetical protein